MLICINLTQDDIARINAIGALANPIVAIVAIIISFTFLKKQLKSSDIALKKQLDDSHIQLKLQLQSANDALIKQLTASTNETSSATAVEFLKIYLNIMDGDSVLSDIPGANKFFRKMLDLMFTEYHLWLNGHIANSVMEGWCSYRRMQYVSDPVYKQTWKKLSEADGDKKTQKDCYFPEKEFVDFINDIHNSNDSEGSIKQIMEKAKNGFKNKSNS